MLKKSIAFLIILTLMIVALSATVTAAPVEGKLRAEWYDLGPEEESTYNKIRDLRDQGELDTILESDFSTYVKTSELSQSGDTSGVGLLMLPSDVLKNFALQNLEGKKSDGEHPNSFGLVITGFITPKEDGKYKFRLFSDDSSRFKLGDEWLCSTWNEPEADGRTWEQERISKEVELKAGEAYPIRVEYFDGWGGHMLEITWSKDGGDFTNIPTEVFSYDAEAETEPTTETSDVSMLMPLLIAGAAAFGTLKLRKK